MDRARSRNASFRRIRKTVSRPRARPELVEALAPKYGANLRHPALGRCWDDFFHFGWLVSRILRQERIPNTIQSVLQCVPRHQLFRWVLGPRGSARTIDDHFEA